MLVSTGVSGFLGFGVWGSFRFGVSGLSMTINSGLGRLNVVDVVAVDVVVEHAVVVDGLGFWSREGSG